MHNTQLEKQLLQVIAQTQMRGETVEIKDKELESLLLREIAEQVQRGLYSVAVGNALRAVPKNKLVLCHDAVGEILRQYGVGNSNVRGASLEQYRFQADQVVDRAKGRKKSWLHIIVGYLAILGGMLPLFMFFVNPPKGGDALGVVGVVFFFFLGGVVLLFSGHGYSWIETNQRIARFLDTLFFWRRRSR